MELKTILIITLVSLCCVRCCLPVGKSKKLHIGDTAYLCIYIGPLNWNTTGKYIRVATTAEADKFSKVKVPHGWTSSDYYNDSLIMKFYDQSTIFTPDFGIGVSASVMGVLSYQHIYRQLLNFTIEHTSAPSTTPSIEPTAIPSIEPTVVPTTNTTLPPTISPTTIPSEVPSMSPTTTQPSESPSSASPTVTPSASPSEIPSISPSFSPTTMSPTILPTLSPSAPTVRRQVQEEEEEEEEDGVVLDDNDKRMEEAFVTVNGVNATVEPTALPTFTPTLHPSNAPTMLPTTFIQQFAVTFPILMLLVEVDYGTVKSVTWDNACNWCDPSNCRANTLNYARQQYTLDGPNCFVFDSDCLLPGSGAYHNYVNALCSLTIYVSWHGTDTVGNSFTSASQRFSRWTDVQMKNYTHSMMKK